MTKKPHFGVYLSSVEEYCQSGIWRGISQFGIDHEINLTVFVSTYQQRIGFPRRHYGITRDFASQAKNLDGLLFFGGTVTDGVGYEEAETIFNKFPHLPKINISMPFGESSVHVDNSGGMRQVVEHLITVHGKRRIAFIRGPEGHREADARYNAYLDALEEADIPHDSSLVWTGSFTVRGGRESVRILLDERRASFDAIVAADDETAIGVMEVLRERGIEVPSDVAVTGFDDIEMAEAHIPSLTTVKQPFYDLGYASASNLLELILTGKEQGERILSPELEIRQSCGCVPSAITKGFDVDFEDLRIMRDSLAATLVNSGVPSHVASGWFAILTKYLLQSGASEELFLQKVDSILSEYCHYRSDLSVWQQVLSQFQSAMSEFVSQSSRLVLVNRIILKSAWLVQSAWHREDKLVELEGNHMQWEIRGIAHDIMTAFDFNDLYGKIESGFRELELGGSGALIALYNRPVIYKDDWDTPEELQVIMAFDQRKRFVEVGEYKKTTLANLLETEEELFGKRLRSAFIMPLFFGDEQLGIVLLEENRSMPVDMYETVRLALSTAIKGATLFREVKDLSIKDELSGLYNRRGFLTLAETRLSHLRRRGGTVTLLFIDLDGLKGINDTYGHSEGDWAISETARILSQATRNGDILARLGGDEFVLFASNAGHTSVDEIEERVRKVFAHFNDEISTKPYQLDCSVGSETANVTEELSLDSLMSGADAVLYREKMNKKSR